MSEHPNGSRVTHATPDGIPAGPGGAAGPSAPAGPVPPGARPPAPDAAPPAPGPALPAWRRWPVGTRVVVRRRLVDGGLGDVLGDLLEVGPDGVLIATRRGPVRVAAGDIALGKPVPPAPPRRAPRVADGVPVDPPAPGSRP